MKKKIISLALVVAMIAIMLTSFTLAYFTDSEQATNEFAAGSVTIDLYETVGHKDGAGKVIAAEQTLGKDSDDKITYQYNNVQPGDKMTKKVTVENTGKSDAYIALAIKQRNYGNFNVHVDDYFEKVVTNQQLTDMGLNTNRETAMQEITDDIFANWGLVYAKNDTLLRYMIRNTNGTSFKDTADVDVLGYGYTNSSTNGGKVQYSYAGQYFTTIKKQDTLEGNFHTMNENNVRMWIIYLKVPAGKSFTADLTTFCPTYFDNYSAQAFEAMTLDVKAFAIQTAGFSTEKAAFTELFKADDCFAY